MANVLLPLLPGSLPNGYCWPASPQQYLNDIMEISRALLPGGMAFYNYGDTVPAVDFQGYPWLRTTDMRWYRYEGVWLSPNPETSLDVRRLFVGAEADVWSYDGGDGSDPSVTAPTANSGAMWEVDHAYDDRLPFGASATVPVATNAGSASISLTEANLPEHTHKLVSPTNQGNDNPVTSTSHIQQDGGVSGGNENYRLTASTTEPSNGVSGLYGTAVPDPIDLRGPVRGTFFIKRTARTNYVAV